MRAEERRVKTNGGRLWQCPPAPLQGTANNDRLSFDDFPVVVKKKAKNFPSWHDLTLPNEANMKIFPSMSGQAVGLFVGRGKLAGFFFFFAFGYISGGRFCNGVTL